MLRLTRCVLVIGVVALIAIGAASCGGGDDGDGQTSAPTATGTEPSEGDAANGASIWEEAGCGGCHTLAAAGSDGTVGPNLDELEPDLDAVVSQVTSGGGGMPAFDDSLSEQEILDVSAYVVQSTNG